MELSENEKYHIRFVDFPFICRICFVRSELTLFEEEKDLWDLFQSLMKIKVHPTADYPKNVCSDCINKLRDISLFIEVSRYTALYFRNNVFSMEVEDGFLPKPETLNQDYDNETPIYCRSCLSTTQLSPFEGKISLLQLFQELTGIDVMTSTDTNSICYKCINKLEEASLFLNLSKRNNGILEILATVDVKKEDLNTDDGERIVGRNELKIEIGDEKAVDSNEKLVSDDCINSSSRSWMKSEEFQNLHTTIDIKEEVLDNENIILSGSIVTKPFGCYNCDKRFATKSNLRSHLLTHSGEKRDYCDKQFTDRSALRTHLLTHTGEKPYKCDHCDKRFTQQSTLKSHLLTHTGEKPFKCDNCDKRFTQKSSLRAHILTHSGKKPFKCDYCDKRFTEKTTLRNHLHTHIGEKSFKCDYCDKRFTLKGNLKSHLLTHTGEKPFKCDYCDKRFYQKRYLRSHSLTHTEKSSRQ